MKHFYLVLFFLAVTVGFSQENPRQSADITGLKLYPNPVTQGRIFIETHQNAPKQIMVFDVLGTQVLQVVLPGKELVLSQLNKGVYIIRIIERNKVATRKLIIK